MKQQQIDDNNKWEELEYRPSAMWTRVTRICAEVYIPSSTSSSSPYWKRIHLRVLFDSPTRFGWHECIRRTLTESLLYLISFHKLKWNTIFGDTCGIVVVMWVFVRKVVSLSREHLHFRKITKFTTNPLSVARFIGIEEHTCFLSLSRTH